MAGSVPKRGRWRHPHGTVLTLFLCGALGSTYALAASGPDLDGDGRVTAADLALMHASMGSKCGQPRYNPAADFDHDCRITGQDLLVVQKNLGVILNRAPAPANDAATTSEDVGTIINVLSNDVDPNGDALAIVAVGSPGHGSAVVAAGGIAYSPQADWSGVDTFTYTVADPKGLTGSASVSVTVLAVNDPPSLSVQADVTEGTAPLSVSFTAIGQDVDGPSLAYTWAFGDGSNGSGPSVTHRFERPGTYQVVAQVSDGTLSASRSLAITVSSSVACGAYCIDTYAGTGFWGEAGEGGSAELADVSRPHHLAAASDGLYIVDWTRLLHVGADGVLTRVRTHTLFDRAPGISVGPDDALYYVEGEVVGSCSEGGVYSTLRVRRLDASGSDPVVAAFDLVDGELRPSCDRAALLAATADGAFYVGAGPLLYHVRPGLPVDWSVIVPEGVMYSLAARADGGAYVGAFSRIDAFGADGSVTPIAGNGSHGSTGDGGLALLGQVGAVGGMAAAPDGGLTFLEIDYSTLTPRGRRVRADGTLETIGGGLFGFSGDDGPALGAGLMFYETTGLALDGGGRFFVADIENNRVRVLQPQP